MGKEGTQIRIKLNWILNGTGNRMNRHRREGLEHTQINETQYVPEFHCESNMSLPKEIRIGRTLLSEYSTLIILFE